MKIVRLENDSSFDSLMQRILGAGQNSAAAKERILELNPHLADFDKLPKGTPILLPVAEGVAADQRTDDVLDTLTDIFDDALAERTQTFAEREQTIDGVLALATDPELRNFLSADPAVRKRLEDIETEARTRREDVAKERDAFKKELDRLRNSIGIRGPKRRAVRS